MLYDDVATVCLNSAGNGPLNDSSAIAQTDRGVGYQDGSMKLEGAAGTAVQRLCMHAVGNTASLLPGTADAATVVLKMHCPQ